MDNSERRRAHYAAETKKDGNDRGGAVKIFLQLICCMGIIAGIIFGGGYKLPIGSTVLGFVQETLETTADFSNVIGVLKENVSHWIDAPKLPAGSENTVFNEETPTSEPSKEHTFN